MLNLKSTVHL